MYIYILAKNTHSYVYVYILINMNICKYNIYILYVCVIYSAPRPEQYTWHMPRNGCCDASPGGKNDQRSDHFSDMDFELAWSCQLAIP